MGNGIGMQPANVRPSRQSEARSHLKLRYLTWCGNSTMLFKMRVLCGERKYVKIMSPGPAALL